jgi:hypothetical protein
VIPVLYEKTKIIPLSKIDEFSRQQHMTPIKLQHIATQFFKKIILF